MHDACTDVIWGLGLAFNRSGFIGQEVAVVRGSFVCQCFKTQTERENERSQLARCRTTPLQHTCACMPPNSQQLLARRQVHQCRRSRKHSLFVTLYLIAKAKTSIIGSF